MEGMRGDCCAGELGAFAPQRLSIVPGSRCTLAHCGAAVPGQKAGGFFLTHHKLGINHSSKKEKELFENAA